MNDVELRSAVKRKVLARYLRDKHTVVLEEMSLRHASARIDLAVVNGILHGFELKSDADTLERLPDQARVYSSVFDRVTLIVGYRHAYEALDVIPDWWGVKLAHKGSRGAIHFSDARSPRDNPAQDPLALAALLWRDEALDLLDEVGKADGFRSKPASAIYQRLVESADLDQVHLRVRQRVAQRKTL